MSHNSGIQVNPATGEVLLPANDPPTANYTSRQAPSKAWCSVDTAPTIIVSFNISSVTDNGVGDYIYNFDTDMANANFVPLMLPSTGNPTFPAASTVTAGSVRMLTRNSGGTLVDVGQRVAVFGDQ